MKYLLTVLISLRFMTTVLAQGNNENGKKLTKRA